MPYQTNHNTYPATHQVPQSLLHKPVYAMPYEHFDGMYANKTDAIYLSIGIAQYDENAKELSAKIMRNIGSQWSPQSEELPIHRPIDLSILIAKVLFDRINNNVEIRGGTYISQKNEIILTQEPRTQAEIKVFQSWIQNNESVIKERLNALCDILNDLRRRNKI